MVEVPVIEWKGDMHCLSQTERNLLSDNLIANPKNDVLLISPSGRELMFTSKLRNSKNVVLVLHAHECGAWVRKVYLNGIDVTFKTRAVIVAPAKGGGSLITIDQPPHSVDLQNNQFDTAVSLEIGRVQLQFKANAPLHSHSYFRALFDGENPKNPRIYSLD